MSHQNSYEDARYADAYAKLEFPDTYFLAFRDLPEIFQAHVTGTNALDFGCGTGRSTRFLRDAGFSAVGIDISEEMVTLARRSDPAGIYTVVPDGDLSEFADDSFDLILSAFAFDNIAIPRKIEILHELRRIVRPTGTIVNLVSTPEIYMNEWLSFTTKQFPKNRDAKSGDIVEIIVTALDDNRPVDDVLCTDETYRAIYKTTELAVKGVHMPLGQKDDPFAWVNEERIPPWAIYVLTPARDERPRSAPTYQFIAAPLTRDVKLRIRDRRERQPVRTCRLHDAKPSAPCCSAHFYVTIPLLALTRECRAN